MKADRWRAAGCHLRCDYALVCGFALLAAGACRTAPTQTNLLLDVELAQPLTGQVDRVGVYGEPWQEKPDPDSEKSSDAVALRDGNVPPFVLTPSPGKTALQALIIAWHGDKPIAWAVFRSAYAAGAARFLKIKLGCAGARDLGMQSGDSAPPTTAIDACKFSGPISEADAGIPNDGGVAGGSPAADGGAGSSAGASGGSIAPPRAGAGGQAGSAANGGAGAGGDADAAVVVAGASGSAAGAGGAGSGGSTVAGAGGNAGSAAGADSGGRTGSAGAGDCYKWVSVDIVSPPDMSSVMPGLIAGTDIRTANPSGSVPNYVCLGMSSTLSGMQVGKASEYGCYVPGSGVTEDTGTSFQLLEAPMDECLVWRPLDTISGAPPNNLKYLGMPLPTPICRVEHDGVGAGAYSTGERVGQLRQENGVWVCRFEFYIADSGHTLANDPGQVPEVLDLAP